VKHLQTLNAHCCELDTEEGGGEQEEQEKYAEEYEMNE
jgi:hypothetical protein